MLILCKKIAYHRRDSNVAGAQIALFTICASDGPILIAKKLSLILRQVYRAICPVCYVSVHRCVKKPGIEGVHALADISRSALCCHSNETRAPIANPPNSAQLEGTPTIPQVTSGSVQ